MEASSMNLLKKISLLFIYILLTGCSSGLDELKRLCEKDAGLTIYKTVEAEGYYDATSIGIGANLIESDYQFMEFCNDAPKFTRAITEPGCWRVSKVKREIGICYERLDKMLAKNVVEPYPKFLKDNCIAVEKIEKPIARYSYHSEPKAWADDDPILKFRRSHVYIKDTKTDEVLGRHVSYSYYNEKGLNKIRKSCHHLSKDYPSYVEANLINTVLMPVSKGVNHD